MLIRLFIALLILVPALYIVAWNTHSVTVYLAPGFQITGNSGIIFISVFILGFALATIFGLYFAVKGYLRERELKKRDYNREAFFEAIVRARDYLAAEDWFRAREEWQQILRRDPDNVIASLELSRSLEGQGDLRGALKIIEEARARRPGNIDVLFRAAELCLEMGNKTAALDNLALVLYHHPNKRAARLARDLSEDLGRYEDALEYQAKLESLLPRSEDREEDVRIRLEFKQAMHEVSSDPQQKKEKLQQFIRSRPNYAPALKEMAEIEVKENKVEAATRTLVKAARQSGSASLWREASEIWMKAEKPDRALSVMKAALDEIGEAEKLNIYLDLSRLYIRLNMLDEANKALEHFFTYARERDLLITETHNRNYYALQSLCLNRMGRHNESSNMLRSMIDGENGQLSAASGKNLSSLQRPQPSPSLSTP